MGGGACWADRCECGRCGTLRGGPRSGARRRDQRGQFRRATEVIEVKMGRHEMIEFAQADHFARQMANTGCVALEWITRSPKKDRRRMSSMIDDFALCLTEVPVKVRGGVENLCAAIHS